MSLIIHDVNSREELAAVLGPAIAREFQARFEEKDAEIARLRAALSTARAEVEGWKSNHAAAEEGWIRAARERDEQARLRRIAEDAIPKGLAVGMEFARAEGFRQGALTQRSECIEIIRAHASDDGIANCIESDLRSTALPTPAPDTEKEGT